MAYVQIPRAYRGSTAISAMERTLAQGQVSPQLLERTEQLLKDEANHRGLLIELRGIRAHLHYMYLQFQEGRFSLAWEQRSQHRGYAAPNIEDYARDFFSRHEIRPAHAWLLRFYTQAVEIAKERGDDAAESLWEQAKASHPPAAADQVSLDRILNI